MEKISLSKKQKKEYDDIVKFFMECIEPITDSGERAMVAAKIMSHLGCFVDRLIGYID